MKRQTKSTEPLELKIAQPSDLLRKAMDAGNVMALFGVLETWSQADLKQLIIDAENWADTLQGIIDKVHAQLAFRPENFFSKERSKAVDDAVTKQHAEVFVQCAEITSVALFYIKE